MGFRFCGAASVQLGSTDNRPGSRQSAAELNRFQSSYNLSFNKAGPARARSSSSLNQIGFLELSKQPKRIGSQGSLARRTPPVPNAREGKSLSDSQALLSYQGPRPSTSPAGPGHAVARGVRQDQDEEPELDATPRGTRRPSATVAEFWSTIPDSSQMLEFAQRKDRRTVQEVLTNPELEGVAKHIFNAFAQRGHYRGEVPGKEVVKIVLALIKKYNLPTYFAGIADSLLKRYDVNGDDMFSFDEFFNVFLAMLRRATFDKSAITGREFFIQGRSDPVWSTWEKSKKLGEGSFGAAFLCKHKRSQEVRVVKAIKKSQAKIPVEDIEREIIIMREIDHPHVVRLFQWHEDNLCIYLVMEALQGGSLRDVLFHKGQKHRPIPEDWVRTVMSQLIEAMAFCHRLRVVHKDLKDENIMLLRQDPDYDKPFAVVIDLGLAEIFSQSDPRGHQCGGTPTTMAPEVWEGDFGPKCDVWSLGIVLYEMFTGNFPFVAKSLRPQAWTRLQKRGANWALVKSSELGKSLCQCMLTYSEDDRPSMAECLKHQWFRSTDIAKSKISPQQFNDLKIFCEQTQLQRTLLLEIASRLPMGKAGQVVEMFQNFDKDKDGCLSKSEMRAAFAEIGIKDEELVAKIFKTLDVDSDGLLVLSEFSAGVIVFFKDLLDDRLQALFARRDRDSSGYLDAEEAKEFLADSTALLTKDANKRSFDLLDELMQGGQTKISYGDLRGKLLGF